MKSDLQVKNLEEDVSGLEAEMDEITRLQHMTEDSETHEGAATQKTTDSSRPDALAPKRDADRRSIYIGNLDYASTPHEVQDYFKNCGQINRITIMVDKYTGHPKGFAYVEFANEESVANALILNETHFRGRIIQVCAKRSNVPGLSRGRGMRGRGRFPTRGFMYHDYRGRGARRFGYGPY